MILCHELQEGIDIVTVDGGDEFSKYFRRFGGFHDGHAEPRGRESGAVYAGPMARVYLLAGAMGISGPGGAGALGKPFWNV
jgi:hypothetical protein